MQPGASSDEELPLWQLARPSRGRAAQQAAPDKPGTAAGALPDCAQAGQHASQAMQRSSSADIPSPVRQAHPDGAAGRSELGASPAAPPSGEARPVVLSSIPGSPARRAQSSVRRTSASAPTGSTAQQRGARHGTCDAAADASGSAGQPLLADGHHTSISQPPSPSQRSAAPTGSPKAVSASCPASAPPAADARPSLEPQTGPCGGTPGGAAARAQQAGVHAQKPAGHCPETVWQPRTAEAAAADAVAVPPRSAGPVASSRAGQALHGTAAEEPECTPVLPSDPVLAAAVPSSGQPAGLQQLVSQELAVSSAWQLAAARSTAPLQPGGESSPCASSQEVAAAHTGQLPRPVTGVGTPPEAAQSSASAQHVQPQQPMPEVGTSRLPGVLCLLDLTRAAAGRCPRSRRAAPGPPCVRQVQDAAAAGTCSWPGCSADLLVARSEEEP